MKIGCSEAVAHTAAIHFIKLGIYRDEERTRHLRKRSTGDESMMKLNVKRTSKKSHIFLINNVKSTYEHDFKRFEL